MAEIRQGAWIEANSADILAANLNNFSNTAIAAGFGGGGHPSAAGFGIKTTLSDLKDKLIQLSETI